jgi:S-layer homology domain
LEKARLYDGLTRFELAKMMSAFIKNVAKVEAVDNALCDITKFSDNALFDDEMKMYIKMACDYGIMGWKNDKSDIIGAFRPNDSVTREEFAAVLSRYLFGSEHDGKDMKAHLEALKNAEIMNQINNPYVVEVRGYVLLMLQRVAEDEEATADQSIKEQTTDEETIEVVVVTTGDVTTGDVTATGTVQS